MFPGYRTQVENVDININNPFVSTDSLYIFFTSIYYISYIFISFKPSFVQARDKRHFLTKIILIILVKEFLLIKIRNFYLPRSLLKYNFIVPIVMF